MAKKISAAEASLYDIARTLMRLHYQGYRPQHGYTVIQAGDCGPGSVYVAVSCLPPEPTTESRIQRMFKKVFG